MKTDFSVPMENCGRATATMRVTGIKVWNFRIRLMVWILRVAVWCAGVVAPKNIALELETK
jgi:hypothetical protein